MYFHQSLSSESTGFWKFDFADLCRRVATGFMITKFSDLRSLQFGNPPEFIPVELLWNMCKASGIFLVGSVLPCVQYKPDAQTITST